jgi:hypothetical protein
MDKHFRHIFVEIFRADGVDVEVWDGSTVHVVGPPWTLEHRFDAVFHGDGQLSRTAESKRIPRYS